MQPEEKAEALPPDDVDESALRASEERFHKFAAASSDALWIRNAKTLEVEFASKAFSSVLGVSTETAHIDPRILMSMIVPEDRDDVLRNVEAIQGGKSVVHDYRILRPSDGAFRWIRSTGFPLFDDAGQVERIAGITTDITEARLSAEHQSVLIAELQHRMRNIMAVIRSVANRSARNADDVQSYQRLLSGRLTALTKVQAFLTRGAGTDTTLRTMIEEEISAHAPQPGQVRLEGPPIALSPKAIEVLTLAIHELTTNAAKYGALVHPGALLAINWSHETRAGTPWLRIEWRESGLHGLIQPKRRGFGSELIERRIPYELNGTGRLDFHSTGLHCILQFPLTDQPSIFETTSRAPVRVHGGSLDLSAAPDLSGYRILVSETDYLLAADLATALRRVGATVIGPFPSEEHALESIGRERPHAAILDVNLGTGADFALAATFAQENVPFLFLTGYDTDIIPADFADVPQLQKPASLLRVMQAMHRLLSDKP